ncbi:hypothetical protein ACFL0B_06500 [Thermodesulfobacteriota bacterium]
MRSSKLIIIVTMSLWDEPHRGRHHYAMALSEKHRILWVNRQLSWREEGAIKTGVEKIKDNLSVLHTGRSILPGRVDHRVNWSNIVRLQLLKKALPDFGTPDIIWIYDYKAVQFAKHYKKKAKIIYFCNDYFGEYAYKRYESKLSKKVDHIFVTAPKLIDRLKIYNSNCACIPHGVWLSGQKLSFKKKLKPETIGFVGALGAGVDRGFFKRILKESDLRLVLAGPIVECTQTERSEFESLFLHPKVEYLGNLSRSEAQKEISKLDICLLAYEVDHPQSGYRFVLKYFDFLAAGKPIAATSYFEWPEPYSKFVSVYHGESGLKEFITSVYSNWNYEQFEKAIQLVEQCTWDKRVLEVGKIIGVDL